MISTSSFPGICRSRCRSLAAYAGCIAGRSGRRSTSALWKQRGFGTSMSSRRADLK